MALAIEKVIDLTAYEGNTWPYEVDQLHIIHESSDGEIVQYYIDPSTQQQGDKNSFAVGVYDDRTDTWSFHAYDELIWNRAKRRVTGNRVEHLSVKAFPGVGAIAVYKLANRNVSRIVAPVNPKYEKKAAPHLNAEIDEYGELYYEITPPEDEKYSCYRIVMRSDDYTFDMVVYELTGYVSPPEIDGEYEVFCIGYVDEGQIQSEDSNVTMISFSTGKIWFEEPYYSTARLDELFGQLGISAEEDDNG